MNDTATPGWLGDIWLADDHCLLLSTLGRTDRHVHYAHQVLVGLGADVEVRVGEQLCSTALASRGNSHNGWAANDSAAAMKPKKNSGAYRARMGDSS
ncbi:MULTISPECIES: hypothetical protein [Pseudomonas]|uniref:Uncharacterized protein n=1 Tax=Pseudomonas monteilii TaxID=76759 RepID=A0AAP7FLD9_9PSED|nr:MULTISPECIES: hypothetical protein [Pseudomonas]KPM60509.1 hypothetical protein HB4184_20985 [Pseudomonas putida]MCE0977615.1 hypothetical protein [Pseudomonas monteilii]MCE1018060.1 hypothetical protein [Pseudomonas monteilii]MCE1034942.1 hypothetical protein [Pseudomonas monteilii]OAH48284.1 hypothetical protein AYJ70_02095 [Pseudomonas monteilii]